MPRLDYNVAGTEMDENIARRKGRGGNKETHLRGFHTERRGTRIGGQHCPD
jgi:hypothetical protein